MTRKQFRSVIQSNELLTVKNVFTHARQGNTVKNRSLRMFDWKFWRFHWRFQIPLDSNSRSIASELNQQT